MLPTQCLVRSWIFSSVFGGLFAMRPSAALVRQWNSNLIFSKQSACNVISFCSHIDSPRLESPCFQALLHFPRQLQGIPFKDPRFCDLYFSTLVLQLRYAGFIAFLLTFPYQTGMTLNLLRLGWIPIRVTRVQGQRIKATHQLFPKETFYIKPQQRAANQENSIFSSWETFSDCLTIIMGWGCFCSHQTADQHKIFLLIQKWTCHCAVYICFTNVPTCIDKTTQSILGKCYEEYISVLFRTGQQHLSGPRVKS